MNQKNWRPYAYYGALALFLVLFTWGFFEVVDALEENEVAAFDKMIIQEVQSWINEGRTARMVFITDLASVKFLTAATGLIALFLLFRKRYGWALFFVLVNGLGGVFNGFLKELFQRQRPDILPLIEQGGYSFPSGHSMGSFIFYGALSFMLFQLVKGKWKKITAAVLAGCMILLVGLTRIYLGVHYPSDVIGGFSIGAAWLFFCIMLFHFTEYWMRRRLSRR
ncbi:phosphatase PAP2 family protein [Domibacillus indicus]|uniref:phosphatase PAP2 family protein n=1 Tax=Domibacillus indicus TaxID=1437523 RepID=UPI000A8EC7B1|nr:phosphatase PAP2 family protein [Domibacillus indicus]